MAGPKARRGTVRSGSTSKSSRGKSVAVGYGDNASTSSVAAPSRGARDSSRKRVVTSRRNGTSDRKRVRSSSHPADRRGAGAEMDFEDDGGEDDDEEEEEDSVTRCICGVNDSESQNFFVQCETCNVWQHGHCVGIPSEQQCPEKYYCEICRPDLHTISRRPKRGEAESQMSSRASSPRRSTTVKRSESRDRSRDPVTQQNGHTREYSHRVYDGKEHTRPRDHSRASASDASMDRSSASPPPRPKDPPKRRATMNSRDAAYDEAIATALLSPGTGMLGDRHIADPHDVAASGSRARRTSSQPSEMHETERTGGAKVLSGEDAHARDAPYPSVARSSRRYEADHNGLHDQNRERHPDRHGVPQSSRSYGGEMGRDEHPNGRARENPSDTSSPNSPTDSRHATQSKRKHPNQYTYRNRDGSRKERDEFKAGHIREDEMEDYVQASQYRSHRDATPSPNNQDLPRLGRETGPKPSSRHVLSRGDSPGSDRAGPSARRSHHPTHDRDAIEFLGKNGTEALPKVEIGTLNPKHLSKRMTLRDMQRHVIGRLGWLDRLGEEIEASQCRQRQYDSLAKQVYGPAACLPLKANSLPGWLPHRSTVASALKPGLTPFSGEQSDRSELAPADADLGSVTVKSHIAKEVDENGRPSMPTLDEFTSHILSRSGSEKTGADALWELQQMKRLMQDWQNTHDAAALEE